MDRQMAGGVDGWMGGLKDGWKEDKGMERQMKGLWEEWVELWKDR